MYNCNKFGVGDFVIYHKIDQVARVTLVLQDFDDHYYYDVVDSSDKEYKDIPERDLDYIRKA